jgi:hypothetical protein
VAGEGGGNDEGGRVVLKRVGEGEFSPPAGPWGKARLVRRVQGSVGVGVTLGGGSAGRGSRTVRPRVIPDTAADEKI